MKLVRPNYQYKTTPKGKQLEVIEDTWHQPYWALLCRPGTGKTKMGLDTAGLLYMAGEITALIVVSPNGVHRQWVQEGVPTHLPESIPWSGGFYESGMGVRATKKLFAALTQREPGLRILAISFDGLQTKEGKKFATELAVAHRALLIVDESHFVSNTKGQAYRAVLKLGGACPYRRIATGTLLRQNPFSAYGQFELLQHAILGFPTLSSFKSMYSQMLPPNHGMVVNIAKAFKERTGRTMTPRIIARDEEDRPIYRNLSHLRKQIARFASFLTLADVQGTEPEVLQSTRYVSPTPGQKAIYEQLQDIGVVQHKGGLLTADSALVLATRLCQIVGGFVPSDDDPEAKSVIGSNTVNPKVQEVLNVIEELGPDEKVIIWCRFTAEITAVLNALASDCSVRYDGTVSEKGKAENKKRFISDPTCRFFVGHIRAGGTGLDGLQAVSNYMVFYSNGYSYTDREQAIARQARTGGSLVVNVIDILMQDTVDNDVVRCMQTAQDVHEKVLRLHVAPTFNGIQ